MISKQADIQYLVLLPILTSNLNGTHMDSATGFHMGPVESVGGG